MQAAHRNSATLILWWKQCEECLLFHCADKNRHRRWLWRCLCDPASTASFIYFFVIIFLCLLDSRTVSAKTLITLAGPRALRIFNLNQRQCRQQTRRGEPQPVFTGKHCSNTFMDSMRTVLHTHTHWHVSEWWTWPKKHGSAAYKGKALGCETQRLPDSPSPTSNPNTRNVVKPLSGFSLTLASASFSGFN